MNSTTTADGCGDEAGPGHPVPDHQPMAWPTKVAETRLRAERGRMKPSDVRPSDSQ
jgi:hypothetical protein